MLQLKLITLKNGGKKKVNTVTFINPNVSKETLKNFAEIFTSLSDNTLQSALRIEKRNLGDFGNLQMLGTSRDDTLTVGNDCTVTSFEGNDILIIPPNVNAVISDFSSEDAISLTSAVDFATFDNGVLNFGTAALLLENVTDIEDFNEVKIYNGENETTLQVLLMEGKTNTAAENRAYFENVIEGNVAFSDLDAEMLAYFNNILYN